MNVTPSSPQESERPSTDLDPHVDLDLQLDFQIATALEASLKKFAVPSHAQLERWVKSALIETSDDTNITTELTIRIVDNDESQQLNHTYRQKNKPTNVLSFPFEAPDGIELPLLGDIVICAPLMMTEARTQNKTPDAHWAHLVVHGTLHLLGYDHQNDDDALEMESLETKILTQLGYADPYCDDHV